MVDGQEDGDSHRERRERRDRDRFTQRGLPHTLMAQDEGVDRKEARLADDVVIAAPDTDHAG